jgi:hypothetical protein
MGGRETESRDNAMFLYAGDYESVEDAKADLKALKELHREHVVR